MVKRYSQEFKDRAVRMLVDCLTGDGSCSQWQAVCEIAPKLGIANESLRRWYEQHLVVTGDAIVNENRGSTAGGARASHPGSERNSRESYASLRSWLAVHEYCL